MKTLFYKHKKLILCFLLILLVFVIAEISGLRGKITLEPIRNLFLNHWIIAYSLYILFFCLGNLIQIPGSVFLAASILALGKIEGYFLTYIAAVISATIGYFIIRFIGGNALRQINYSWVKELIILMDKKPIQVNFLLRSIFQTAPQLNYTLALSGVDFKSYIIGALIGLPIPIFIYTIFIEEVIHVLINK